MDTHITDHPLIVDQDAPVSMARLPGEPDMVSSAHPVAPDATADKSSDIAPDVPAKPEARRRGRTLLLSGAALLVLGAGSVGFLVSPYNTVLPVPGLTAKVNQMAVSAGFEHPPLIAPSATLARVPLPSEDPPVREGYTPKARSETLREIVSLHPNATAVDAGTGMAAGTAPGPKQASPVQRQKVAASPVQPTAPDTATATASVRAQPPVSVTATALTVAEPGGQLVSAPRAPSDARPLLPDTGAPGDESGSQTMTPVSGQNAAKPLPSVNSPMVPFVAASSSAAVPDAAAVTSSAGPAVRAADPVSIGEHLRAAPMSSPEQVQVLDLVTQLAKLVHDLRAQDVQLRADLRRATAEYASRLDDYGRRLALAEAKNSMDRAARDVEGPSTPDLPAATPVALPIMARSAPIAITAPASQSAAPSGVLKRYRVQAASPGLAMLAEVERGGGEGAQLQVTVGDSLPDYGRVKSIAQRGTTWVVTAERGTIQ